MTKLEFERETKALDCAKKSYTGDCGADCNFSPTLGCVPATMNPKNGRFIEGGRKLVFRSKLPKFTLEVPIKPDTLFGEYRGAIRFSPQSGRLHLCYGPIDVDGTAAKKLPLLDLLVKDKVKDDLWKWYQMQGKNLFREKKLALMKTYNSENFDSELYADIYGLPGAYVQLSYQEIMYLDESIRNNNNTSPGAYTDLNGMVGPPKNCPPFVQDCTSETLAGPTPTAAPFEITKQHASANTARLASLVQRSANLHKTPVRTRVFPTNDRLDISA